MAAIHPAKRVAGQRKHWTLGPPVCFAVAASTSLAGLVLAAATLPHDLVLPLTSGLFLVLAGVVAFIAWSGGRPEGQAAQVTYWDVAGALTFIGICAASLVDPDQMVRLVEGAHREP